MTTPRRRRSTERDPAVLATDELAKLLTTSSSTEWAGKVLTWALAAWEESYVAFVSRKLAGSALRFELDLVDVLQETSIKVLEWLSDDWTQSGLSAMAAQGKVEDAARVIDKRFFCLLRRMLDHQWRAGNQAERDRDRTIPLPQELQAPPCASELDSVLDLRAVLQDLRSIFSEKECELVQLRFIEERSPTDIATHFGVDLRTIQRRILRVLEVLGGYLSAGCEGDNR